MKEAFELTLAGRTYLLHRLDHPEMEKTAYRIEFRHGGQPLSFRMTRSGDHWVRIPQSLPYYVNMDGCLLADAIAQNESESL
ncbi:MAG: hypothetical protein JWP69_963 [Flaviaesturariibacter sp.]|nr:hypothetical protein [Flaviaesturariibacter sp.]